MIYDVTVRQSIFFWDTPMTWSRTEFINFRKICAGAPCVECCQATRPEASGSACAHHRLPSSGYGNVMMSMALSLTHSHLWFQQAYLQLPLVFRLPYPHCSPRPLRRWYLLSSPWRPSTTYLSSNIPVQLLPFSQRHGRHNYWVRRMKWLKIWPSGYLQLMFSQTLRYGNYTSIRAAYWIYVFRLVWTHLIFSKRWSRVALMSSEQQQRGNSRSPLSLVLRKRSLPGRRGYEIPTRPRNQPTTTRCNYTLIRNLYSLIVDALRLASRHGVETFAY